MSRNRLSPSPNKQAIKKKQSQLKALVNNFGCMILNWRSDSAQVTSLLTQMSGDIGKIGAIERAHSLRSDVFPNSRGVPSKLPAALPPLLTEEVVLSITHSILMEIQSSFSQISSFNKSMTDTECAMVKIAEDCMKVVTNEHVEAFDADCIFTPEHAVEIATLQRQFSRERARKKALLQRCLYSATTQSAADSYIQITAGDGRTGTANNSIPTAAVSGHSKGQILGRLDLNGLLLQWPDECDSSFIDDGLVVEFLRRNNIKNGGSSNG